MDARYLGQHVFAKRRFPVAQEHLPRYRVFTIELELRFCELGFIYIRDSYKTAICSTVSGIADVYVSSIRRIVLSPANNKSWNFCLSDEILQEFPLGD